MKEDWKPILFIRTNTIYFLIKKKRKWKIYLNNAS